MMKHGAIRQVAPTLAGIQEDHKNRYRWVASDVPKNKTIIDAGCGIGYGSWLMAQFHNVYAYELDEEALVYARKHYAQPRVVHAQANLTHNQELPAAYAAVCFEMLEHTSAEPVLHNLHAAEVLYCSVPNQEVIPWNQEQFPEHLRHYTPNEFVSLLEDNGWTVQKLLGQVSKTDAAIRATVVNCRTLLAFAVRK